MDDITFLLLQYWGAFMMTMGVLILFFPPIIKRLTAMVNDEKLSVVFGIMTLMIGLAHIILHNEWGNWLEIIVSIFGWSAFIKGFLFLGFPDLAKITAGLFKGKILSFMSLIIIALGAFLLYKGLGY